MLEPSSQDHYENYVASYMDWANSTEGIDTSKMHPSFLRRYVCLVLFYQKIIETKVEKIRVLNEIQYLNNIEIGNQMIDI